MPTARTAENPPLSPALGERERNYVYAVAMKYVKNPIAAEDVAQDALLLAHRHRASFRGGSRYSTWLYRVAATTALMYLRALRRRHDRAGEAEPLPDQHRDPAPSPERRLAAAEEVAHAAREVHAMGDKYERIFWMRAADGYTEAEIADRLGLALSTVKTRAHRAKLALLQGIPRLA